MNKTLKITTLLGLALLSACATTVDSKDYSDFRNADPHSILVLPALNNSGAVEAPEFFLSTISQPFAQRGYYVFPANMVKGLLEDNGLSDPALLYAADANRLKPLFGCDSALYLSIDKWESKYAVIATSTNVAFNYELRSCDSGKVLWSNAQTLSYSPSASGSGNIFADLVAQAVISALEKGAPNYIPLAQQANLLASSTLGQGLPAGPYLADDYNNDLETFPRKSNEPSSSELD